MFSMNKHFLASALLLSALAAHADPSSKLYGDVGLTFVSYEENDSGDVFTSSPKAVRLIGGAELGRNVDVEVMLGFGAESDTVKYQGITYSDFTLKIDSMYGFYVKPKFELAPNIEVFARLGYVHAAATASITDYGSDTSTENGLSYGVGLKMKIDPKVSFNIDYMSYLNKPDYSAKGLTFGVGFRF